jgi:hypothetical protein
LRVTDEKEGQYLFPSTENQGHQDRNGMINKTVKKKQV